MRFRSAQQTPFKPHQTLVDRVELIHKTVDTVVVERQALHFINNIIFELLVAALLRR